MAGALYWGTCCLFVVVFLVPGGLGSCRGMDTNPSLMFSSMTAYNAVRGTQVQVEDIEGCGAVLFYLMSRHGSRYATAKQIQQMDTQLPALQTRIVQAAQRGQGELCIQDLGALRNWRMRMEVSNGYKLSDSGEDEMRGMATRYKQRFPSLLSRDYSSEDFRFRSTMTQRTRKSAEAYAEGLFGTESTVDIRELSVENDTLLRFYKNCDRYDELVWDTPVEEEEKFVQSARMNATLSRIARRLGIDAATINHKLLELVFTTCSFEYAVYGDSPWCSVFSSEDLKVMAYPRDMFFYYKKGYGYDINYQMACPVLSDIVEQFRSVMSTQSPVAVHRFGHNGNIYGTVLQLGLFKDATHLTADDFNPDQSKLWNISAFAPEAANIALALYRCGVDYKIKLFVNEKPTILPGCLDFVCPLDVFWEKWQHLGDSCDFENVCNADGNQESRDTHAVSRDSASLADIGICNICLILWAVLLHLVRT